MKRWWTSDLHIGDPWASKRRYCGEDIAKHNNWLASRWDAKISPEDEVWVLGDNACEMTEELALEWYGERPGRKNLVLGNLDNPLWDWDRVFEIVTNTATMTLSDGTNVYMSHFPWGNPANPEPLEGEGPQVLLHGHTHRPSKFSHSSSGLLMVHVGWEAWRRVVPEEDITALITGEKEE